MMNGLIEPLKAFAVDIDKLKICGNINLVMVIQLQDCEIWLRVC